MEQVLRRIHFEQGAFTGWHKTPTWREYSVLKNVRDDPPGETPGWHSGEGDTCVCLSYLAEHSLLAILRMEGAEADRANPPRAGPGGVTRPVFKAGLLQTLLTALVRGAQPVTLSAAKGLVVRREILRFAQNDNGDDFATAPVFKVLTLDRTPVLTYNGSRTGVLLPWLSEDCVELRPCPFRQVDDDGHILCAKLKSADREISPRVCAACPVAEIDCVHLRAALSRTGHPPLLVRYGNGKSELWEESAPTISFASAACAARTAPIRSPQDCAACALRETPSLPLVLASSALLVPPAGRTAARGGRPRSATKIIQNIQWPSGPTPAPASAAPRIQVSPVAMSNSYARPLRIEEKPVGWTD
ncbi:MAG: hypothetical protein M1570_04400 [Chloroflexi bacterium]|nr:hypothetical protein [Chloroflexota bacterium]